ncbi:uncharacterized protein LOC114579380 [Dendrobium catenatum]|uniref:uncharacterized protein LOC114579380 n=1 Tax=Dendrobium catenatum TaxID=906689 RepID=UPI00109F5612|nr:uncharacterized protein LOC114579380 [Dendrobium catenatum]
MTLRRLVALDFNYILEKAASKLNVWGNKLISLAGKFVLVKFVLVALPVFVATHSLVPMSVLKEVDNAARSFIWDRRGGLHGLHYMSCEKMCKTWKEGGQGIHSVAAVTGSLRAKFPRKFLKGEESLLNRTLLAKWKFATGKSLDIMKDVWILVISLDKWPTFIVVGNFEFPSLENFNSNGCWKEHLLNKFFGEALMELIMHIEIFPDQNKYMLELRQRFSSKSIVVMASYSYGNNEPVEYGSWLKKLHLNPKIECFWWRLLNDALPTNGFLMYQRLLGQRLCPRGCNEPENADYVMVQCLKLKQEIGVLKNWGFPVPDFTYANDYKLILKKLVEHNNSIANLYCSLVYFSWKSRNLFKHGEQELSLNYIASSAISYASISKSNLFLDHWSANQPDRLFSHWHPPPPEWIKVNLEVDLISYYNGGIGGIVRDSEGRFLLAFGINFTHWDSGLLELLAVYSLKKFMFDWMLEAKGFIIEGKGLQ